LRVLGDELLQVKYEKKCREVEELQKALAAGELRYQQLKQEQSTRREEQQQQQMETEDADYSDMTINQHLPLTNPLKQSLLTRPVIPLAPPIGLKQQQQQHQQQQRNSNWLASMMTRRQRRPPIIKPASIDDCSNILKLPPIDHQASNTIQ
jgi:hypothetical protein